MSRTPMHCLVVNSVRDLAIRFGMVPSASMRLSGLEAKEPEPMLMYL